MLCCCAMGRCRARLTEEEGDTGRLQEGGVNIGMPTEDDDNDKHML